MRASSNIKKHPSSTPRTTAAMDNTASKASGGVRNLRAMFENHDKSEESTPSPQPNRGRSGAPESGKLLSFPTVNTLSAVEYNALSLRGSCGG